jgi:hypothetical protein
MHVRVTGCVDMDLTHVTQRKAHWWGAGNMALDPQFSRRLQSLSAEQLLAFRGAICEVRGSW